MTCLLHVKEDAKYFYKCNCEREAKQKDVQRATAVYPRVDDLTRDLLIAALNPHVEHHEQ